ncbi:MAG: hypothetical protein F4246_10275 [Rhodothermaceae bacterium]|nr:hypothetical protein [Rhodothermaceae bacterium]MXX58040.1 hypothetical protein [Rhodothermaceae bacterium]MYD18592.1 hypothetical protein [Rhodothermaceae bacterium]MYD57387.1 hypothetical protein [Rhodothermaceae bacterium]MYI44477.1 hypothetical protein [Rhodothermaceae bacterium]
MSVILDPCALSKCYGLCDGGVDSIALLPVS